MPLAPPHHMSETMLRQAKVEIIVQQLQASGSTLPRSSLFLDEVVDVQLLLQSTAPEAAVLAELPKLSITLDAYAVEPQNGLDQASEQLKDLVSSESLDASSGYTKPSASHKTTITWSTKVHIDRTRISSLSSSMTLTASLTLATPITPTTSLDTARETYDDYLTPGVPSSSANLLISLAQSSAFVNSTNPPSLPASRLLRTLPARPCSNTPPQIPLVSRESSTSFQLLPAVTSNLRTYGIGTCDMAKVLANLEVEVSKHVQAATIPEVIVELEHGVAVPQGVRSKENSTRKLRSGDVASLVYDMQPSQRHRRTNDFVDRIHPKDEPHRVKMSLSANVITHGNDPFSVNVLSTWQTPVDLISLLQATTRSTTVSSTSSQQLSHLVTLTTSRHTGMPQPTPRGSAIRWNLLVANRSTTQTLNLAIVPVMIGANPQTVRVVSGNGDPTVTSVASVRIGSDAQNLPAWLYAPFRTHSKDDHAIKPASAAISRENISTRPSLKALTPLILLGPLPPGTSTTAEAVFLLISESGQLGSVEALRIVDLESRPKDGKGRWKWIDVKGDLLPDIVIAEIPPLSTSYVDNVDSQSQGHNNNGTGKVIEQHEK